MVLEIAALRRYDRRGLGMMLMVHLLCLVGRGRYGGLPLVLLRIRERSLHVGRRVRMLAIGGLLRCRVVHHEECLPCGVKKV